MSRQSILGLNSKAYKSRMDAMNMRQLLFILIFLSLSTVVLAEEPFPEDCWGVYSWAGWNTKKVTRANCPLINGAPIILKWNQVEPEPGSFVFDRQLRDKLERALENDFYVFVMIWVAPNAPRWLFENGVPELEMTPTISPRRKPRNWTFQYYLDEDYIGYYYRLIREFGKYVRNLPADLQYRILYVQSAEGSTGDGYCYKGDPLDEQYKIDRDQWSQFRIDAWAVFKEAFSDSGGRMVKPLLVNYDSNRQLEYDWLLGNLDTIGLKNGMFSHGYHISDTQHRLEQWRRFVSDAIARDKTFFSRGEQDAEWQVCGWSSRNTQQALYWSALFATHCGLDMWNLPQDACQGEAYAPAINFFNRYAGQHDAAKSPIAFCALRKGLDAADVSTYPAAMYGKAQKNNVERYVKIADAFSVYGAIQGDPDKATGGGMKNRQRDHYNDVGWGILAGNYYRFLEQIDPESTSVGWWHVDVIKQNHSYADASIYSRFARGFDNTSGKNALYFDLHDDLFGTSNLKAGITFTVIYHDGVPNSSWKLQYDNGSRSMATALAVTNTGSGTWKTLKVTVTDAAFENGGPKGADIALVNTDSLDDVFHLIEVELTKNNPRD